MSPSAAENLRKTASSAQRGRQAHIEEYDDWQRPNAGIYHEYAKKLCEGYRFSKAKYAQAHDLNRGSVNHLQRKFFAALAQALKERDEADGRNHLQPRQVHNKRIQKGRFSFRLTAPYSDQRKKVASEAAKRHSINLSRHVHNDVL